jgi:elongation factor 2
LTKFADIYAQKFKISRDVMIQKLWGDNYYDPIKKRWNTTGYSEDGSKLDRAFVQFIMKPIIQL